MQRSHFAGHEGGELPLVPTPTDPEKIRELARRGSRPDFREAIYDPDVFGFAWLMQVLTRFIDELMERAACSGATRWLSGGPDLNTRPDRGMSFLICADPPRKQHWTNIRHSELLIFTGN